MVPAVRSLYTVTCFFWPILHARSRACSREDHQTEREVAQLRPTLCDPMVAGSSAHGIFQARVLEGAVIPSPGHSREMQLNKGPSQQQALTNSQSLPSTPQIRALANEAKYLIHILHLLRNTNRQETKQTKPALPVSSHVLSAHGSSADAADTLRRPSLQAEDETQPGCEL